MTKVLLLAALLWLPVVSHAASWLENDYSFGSNGFKKESLTFFSNVSTRVVAGANASFYKDSGFYSGRVYSFRFPLMYSGDKFFISLRPFFYPSTADIRSKAQGGKLSLLVPVTQEADESYLHLIFSGAAARQETTLTLSPARETFSEASFEIQAEKSYYNQFFFLASAAGFSKPEKAANSNLINPALDHGEMAYLGAFGTITRLPEWAAVVQIARNMAPDYNSYLYAGFSRISFRSAGAAGSLLAGIKLKFNDKSSLDLGYNFYKQGGEAGKNYYKLLAQVFF